MTTPVGADRAQRGRVPEWRNGRAAQRIAADLSQWLRPRKRVAAAA